MPVRNEEKHINQCLSQLVRQTYPKDRTEIIVVDGMSEDNTRRIVTEFSRAQKRTKGPDIRLVDNPKRNLYAALNLGIKRANGDVILRVDGRSICHVDYVDRCVETLLETGADNVGGMQKPVGRTLTQKAIALAMSHPFGVGNAKYRVARKSGYADTVYLGCFRREVLDRIGGFDEESRVISEDSDFNERIKRAGGKVYLNCDIKVDYYPRDTIRQHCKIYFIWGKARAGFFRKHRRLTSWRQLAPPLFVVITMLLLIGAVLSSVARLFLTIAALSYFFCDLLVAGYLAVRERNLAFFPLLIVVFPTMHFAWGLGFLLGLTCRLAGENYWR
jgi:glycosyltransferase involved in cell wall biosynthesis